MENLANIIESILFVSGDAVAIKDIAEKLEVSEREINSAVKDLMIKYGESSGITLITFNKKLQFCSNSKYADMVSSVLNPIKEKELSRTMLEVAAIIAYKQPVTRIDLEELRGSSSEFQIQNLLKLGIIEVVGRKETVGKPVLFGTTDEFLKRFQISSLDELPRYEELIAQIKALRGESSNSSYLFQKDVYVEEDDTVKSEIASTSDDIDSAQDEFDLPDIGDEDVPDFLSDEDIDVIE